MFRSHIFSFLYVFGLVAPIIAKHHIIGIESTSTKNLLDSEDETETSKDIEDIFYMVEVSKNMFVGSAQILRRRFPPPEEQIVVPSFKKFISFTDPLKKLNDSNLNTTIHPEFGFLSLANNIAVKIINVTKNNKNVFYVIRRNNNLKINQKLTAYIHNGEDPPQLVDIKVKIISFTECEMAFDPENLYLVDKKEQFCTTLGYENELAGTDEDEVKAALLFDEDNYLVGIQSKANEKYALATFVPFHCDFLKRVAGKEVCF